jgi:hypothetical protein
MDLILVPLIGRTFTQTAASLSHPDRTVTSFRADAEIELDPDTGWPSALVTTRTESLEYEPSVWKFRTHILSAATDPVGTVLVALGRTLPRVETHRLLWRLDPATGRFTEEVELAWLASTPGFADRPVLIGYCQRKVDWDPTHDALGFHARVVGFLREAVCEIAGPFDIPAERRHLERSFVYDNSPGTTEYSGLIEGGGQRGAPARLAGFRELDDSDRLPLDAPDETTDGGCRSGPRSGSSRHGRPWRGPGDLVRTAL